MPKFSLQKLILVSLFFAHQVLAWQDDAHLFLRNPLTNFPEAGFAFLPSAQSELRLGRYLVADDNHGWRGGAMGDVALLSFGPNLLWRWELNMETLIDDQNDISFRLVQVYYQTRTGISWILGPGVWSFSYNHRCSHGADSAVPGRILIRSGLNSAYYLPLSHKNIQYDLQLGTNIYLVGQNSDLLNQPRANLHLDAQIQWPIAGAWSMLVAGSFGEELTAQGASDAYSAMAPAKNLHLRPFYGARIGLRVEKQYVKNDYSLSFSHIPDTGLHSAARANHGLSFDINFYW